MYIILDLFVFMFLWCFTFYLNHRTPTRLFTLFSLHKTFHFFGHKKNFVIRILINILLFLPSLEKSVGFAGRNISKHQAIYRPTSQHLPQAHITPILKKNPNILIYARKSFTRGTI